MTLRASAVKDSSHAPSASSVIPKGESGYALIIRVFQSGTEKPVSDFLFRLMWKAESGRMLRAAPQL
jgi:hypothetical protein